MLQRAYDLICFDVDGTLVRHPTGKVIWEVLNERFMGDHTINIERHRWYNEGRISYEQWVELDVQGWITAGATRGDIVEAVREFEHFDGAHDTLWELKRRGARLAIISGTLDIVIDTLFPEHPFDDVYSNRLIFGPSITEIPVAQVYRAAHELIAISRTDSLFRAEKYL